MNKQSVISSLCTIGAFLTICGVHHLLLPQKLFIGAFGASAVLAFSNKDLQILPKHLFIGATFSALIGITAIYLIQNHIASTITAITCTILCMNLCNIHYPPGGAIAIIPSLNTSLYQELNFTYVFFPVLTGIGIIYLFTRINQYLISKFI